MVPPDFFAKWILRVAGSFGLAAFLFFFALTYRVPHWVETFARDFIAAEVRDEVGARIDAIGPPRGDSAADRIAKALYERNAREIEDIKSRLKDRSRDLFLSSLDQVRDLSCECRERIEVVWRGLQVSRLREMLADNQRIQPFIHASYMDVVDELRREFRIFTGTNAAAFLLVLVVSFARPRAARHLLLPGVLLLCATLFCAWLYLFSQNWLLTVIHGDYTGYAYAAWLTVAFLLMGDIALNRARVTTGLVNGMSSAVGSAFSLSPC